MVVAVMPCVLSPKAGRVSKAMATKATIACQTRIVFGLPVCWHHIGVRPEFKHALALPGNSPLALDLLSA
jgi:hypothetical protein